MTDITSKDLCTCGHFKPQHDLHLGGADFCGIFSCHCAGFTTEKV